MSYSSPYSEQDYQRRQDDEHLGLLAIFHYVYGGLVALGSCAFLFYILMGFLFEKAVRTTAPTAPSSSPPPEGFGMLFAAFGIVGLVIGWLLAGLTIYAGICLTQRKNSTLIYIVDAINCLNVPLGTALGVFTFVVLSRPSVRAQFDPAFAASMAASQHPGSSQQQSWYNDYDRR